MNNMRTTTQYKIFIIILVNTRLVHSLHVSKEKRDSKRPASPVLKASGGAVNTDACGSIRESVHCHNTNISFTKGRVANVVSTFGELYG